METNLLSLRFMARHLRVPQKWLRAQAEAGLIPHLDAGGQLLFNPEAVEAVLLERARSSAAPATPDPRGAKQ